MEYHGLLISSARTLERSASSEVYYLLSEILGCSVVDVKPVREIPGLSIATFSDDPILILEKIKTEIEQDQSFLQYTLKIIPIQYKVSTSLDKLRQLAIVFNDLIDNDKTWRINLRRRHSQLSREDIIGAVAEKITNGKVMLENSDYYIFIETLGKWTYLSISRQPELSISKLKIDDNNDSFTF
ncbi:MAG: THUMP domain-containing protein [Candidatus Heimdallarchaeaceae archaeon]|jgi:tRNA(Ser,Leu) C12 N-acetylase TAN1